MPYHGYESVYQTEWKWYDVLAINCSLTNRNLKQHKTKILGIPEINLAPIDPLYVPELNIVQGNGPVNIKMHLKNIKFFGFSTAQVSKVVYANTQLLI